MEYYTTDELYHWGVKGMKWGIRRYQNKDGSLTPAGGKRYNGSDYKPRKSIVQTVKDYRTASKKKANLKKAREARAAKKAEEEKAKIAAEQRKKDVESGKISSRKMTTEELQSRIDRLNMEKRYKQLLDETDPASKAKSVGQGFVKKMWNEAVQPAMAEAGKSVLKDVLTKQMRKATGLDVDNKALDSLKKEYETLDLKQKISNAKKNIYDNEKHMNGKQEDESAKLKREADDAFNMWRKEKYTNDMAKEKGFKGDDNKSSSEQMKAKESAQKKVDEYNESGHGQDSVTSEPVYGRKSNGVNKPAENPPAVVKSSITNLSNVNVNSKEYADRVYKGEKTAFEVIDTVSGKTLAKYDENGKRKLW